MKLYGGNIRPALSLFWNSGRYTVCVHGISPEHLQVLPLSWVFCHTWSFSHFPANPPLNIASLLRDKDKLKQSIEEFYQELREQKRKHWLDKQELEKERRRIEREFQQSDFDDLFDIL